jgi:PAS domain S-box-containing protein
VTPKESEALAQVAELERALETYKGLLGNVRDLVWRTDPRGQVLYVNGYVEELLGYTPQEALGGTLADYLTPEAAARVTAEALRTVFATPPAACFTAEVEYRHKRGDLVAAELRVSAERAATGEIVALTGVARDIAGPRRTERALRESQERYRLIAENTSDGILWLGADHRPEYVSPAYLRQLGYSEAEELSRTADDIRAIVHPDDRDALFTRIYRAIDAKEDRLVYSYRARHAAGHYIWRQDSAQLRYDDAGRYLGCCIVCRDVTEQKRAEEALRESEARFRALFDNSGDAVMTLEPPLWRFTACNRATLAMFGAEDEAHFTNRAPWEWSPERQADGRDSAEAARAMIAIALREGYHAFEWTHRRVSGEPFPASVLLSRTEAGGGQFLQATVRDITEQKRIEADLEESREKFRGLSDASFDAIFISEKGLCLEQNRRAEEMFGYTNEEAVGRPGTEWIIAADRERVIKNMMDGHERPYEAMGLRKDGSTFPAILHGRMMRFKGRAVRVTSMTDITDLKRAELEKAALEAQLRQAQKLDSVGRLAGGIAHDFNNMLSVILGCTHLLMLDVDPGHPFFPELEAIRTAAERSATLTRRLLALARQQIVDPRALDLNDTVAGMLKMLTTLIGEAIELRWEPGEGAWPVLVDPAQLDHILANLCVNARDAIAGIGRITIQTGNRTFDARDCASRADLTPGDYVRLTVEDDGCGMDEETLGHAFEPFFTTKPMGKGTGLGLASVYGAVKQSRGTIEVESQPGKGTTFSIFLPRHVADAEPAGAARPVIAPRRGQETILVVEDEPALLTVLTSMLQGLGYAVLSAGGAREAIRVVSEHPHAIDLLLTDVVMPEMSGLELAKNLLSLRPGLRRLFMSGYAADLVANRGVRAEGHHFLHKPITHDALAARVRQALDDERVPSSTRGRDQPEGG